MSVVIDIADAVVEALRESTLTWDGLALAPVRAYRPFVRLEDLTGLLVTVVPRSLETAIGARGFVDETVRVDVAVQCRLPSDPEELLEEADGLMKLVEDIGKFLSGRALGATFTAHWLATVNEPIYAPEHLPTLNVFTSVLTLTYRAEIALTR